MKTMLISLVSVMLMLSVVSAAPRADMPADKTTGGKTSNIDNEHYIDANRILMFVTNHGNFGCDLSGVFGFDYGTWYPYSGDPDDIENDEKNAGQHSPLYAAGLWIGAVDSATGETRVVLSEYSSEYVPGPMVNGSYLPDRYDFRVYKIYRDSLAGNPNGDFINWPKDQGAPYDIIGDPIMLGDQMLWSIFNDANPSAHNNNSGYTTPLGLEIRQTTYAYYRQGSLGNTVFLRWRIFNKGDNTLKDCYFSIWADPDLGGAADDLVGCDTIRALGFAYNGDNVDSQYANMPIPCLGIDLLQSPMIATGNPDDYGYMWGKIWPGYKNPGMTSFNKYINGTDPDDFTESFNYMRGLTRNGDPYVYDGDTLAFVCSGNPVAGIGDLDFNPADRRFMMTSGPYDFRPGDSTEIIAALVMGQGSNRLNSITEMKYADDYVESLYYDGFDDPTDADDNRPAMPNEFSLAQNHPNPFNPSTNIDFTLPRAGRVRIDVFDILGRQTALILDDNLSAGRHSIVWDGKDADGETVASGIYFYRLRAGDQVETRKMLLLK